MTKKSQLYLNEVKKQNILDSLKSVEKYVSSLRKTISNSKYLDDDTKENILSLQETIKEIYNSEMNKELKRQKENGKEFLTDDEIDELVDKIIKNENE